MATAVLRGARWAATPVVAALAALAAQIVVYRTSIELLDVTVGIQGSSLLWAAKTFTSVFMGAAFVVGAWGVAPASKRQAAVVALGIVVLWGARLMLSGLEGGLMVWLLAMGAAGIVGGALAFWRLRNREASGAYALLTRAARMERAVGANSRASRSSSFQAGAW